jgi:hypothetical protein
MDGGSEGDLSITAGPSRRRHRFDTVALSSTRTPAGLAYQSGSADALDRSPESRDILPAPWVTVMVVTSTWQRGKQLRSWTARGLKTLGLFAQYASIYAFGDVSPVATPAVDFFIRRYWYPPFTSNPDSLIDIPDSETDRSQTIRPRIQTRNQSVKKDACELNPIGGTELVDPPLSG